MDAWVECKTNRRVCSDCSGCSQASDGSLAVAIAVQCKSAWAELYRRHSGSVTAATRMILGNSALCDDVVAEVFIGLWLSPETFDPERGSLLGWLRMKARARSIDALRNETSRRRREEATGFSRPGPTPDIDTDLLAFETAVELRRALTSLPSREAEAIRLAYLEGMSYRRVALHLKVAEGTVKSRIRSGLRRLSTDVQPHGAAPEVAALDEDTDSPW